MALAMPIRLLDLDEPHAWGPDLTAGLITTVPDDARERALREVVIDVSLTDPTCSDYSWSLGIADVVSGLVCIGDGYWCPDGRAYYLLAHELAHIMVAVTVVVPPVVGEVVAQGLSVDGGVGNAVLVGDLDVHDAGQPFPLGVPRVE